MKSKPAAQTILPWLRENLGPQALAPLTGTDTKALLAAVQLIELYAYHSDESVLEAFSIAVTCMQSTTREFAYHSIAHILDWHDREPIWRQASLPRDFTPRICKFEPQCHIPDPKPSPPV